MLILEVSIGNQIIIYMKNTIKIFAVLFISVLTLSTTSCSKDDDPTNNDLFVGTYRGPISFTSDSESKSADNGSITVVKVGDKYNFVFSDGIENITGVEFREDDDNLFINVGGDETSYIRINESTLKILYIKDGKTWTANCTR